MAKSLKQLIHLVVSWHAFLAVLKAIVQGGMGRIDSTGLFVIFLVAFYLPVFFLRSTHPRIHAYYSVFFFGAMTISLLVQFLSPGLIPTHFLRMWIFSPLPILLAAVTDKLNKH